MSIEENYAKELLNSLIFHEQILEKNNIAITGKYKQFVSSLHEKIYGKNKNQYKSIYLK